MASAVVTVTPLISTILEPMAAKAMEKVKAMVVNKVDGIVNIERDISKLQTTLRMIQSIVPLAEEKQNDDDFIRNWLRDLADIANESRDVLDDFITFSSIIAPKLVNFINSLMPCCFCGSSKLPLAALNRLAKDIRSVTERFDVKIKESEKFNTLRSVVEGGGSESISVDLRPKVGASRNKKKDGPVLGREKVKEGIMEKILHSSDDPVHVVVIWGMGGIGKTTLAQSIYNDERVKEVPRSWLCVGVNKFSAEKVIKEIVNDKNTIGIVNLQTKLVEKFEGNRFLIVLDDVWDVDGSEWNLLFDPLTNVEKGGLIIITRREKEVCPALINIQTAYDLKPLSKEDSWSIFESCAYVNGKSESTPDLKRIGDNIVKKLNGHPLALKVVGRSLLNKDYSTWTDFLESKFSEDDEVMSALRWSYNHLPPHLKMCFTYCSLFSEDRVLDKNVLVEMWMAHDLIEKKEQERPEDVGAQYFEELVNASMFQCVDGTYVIHDLIHDLAQFVSNGEFASTISRSLTNDQMKNVRHITITPDDYTKIPRLCEMEKLLTLYTIGNYEESWCDDSVFDDAFKQLKSIRVLVLVSSKITDIPDCISELRDLRYLDVSRTIVESLPDSLCRLYNLQMLAAPPYVGLPIDIVNISSLRYLRASLSTCKGVGKLTSLQELSFIYVCEGDNIRELGDMQILRGKLSIEVLGNVSTLEGDGGALMEKQTLMDELELTFHQQLEKSTISEEVLDALGCPPNLTYLQIYGYTGVKSPCWMVDRKHKFDKLQTLELSHCSKLESLPPLGELTSLKRLSLRNVGVKRLGDEFYGKFTDSKLFFPSLESLCFYDMEEWVEWDGIIIENSSVSFFPRLTMLELSHCPKLESLPPLGELTSLKYLSLQNVGVKRLGDEFYGKFTDSKIFFPSLESLCFYDMEEWEEWDGIIIENSSVSFFPRLTMLELSHCPKLESLPPLGELTSLKRLSLWKVAVKRLGEEFFGKFTDGKVFFPSLESLSFCVMEDWEKWDGIIIDHSNVSFFPRLTELKVMFCSKLASLLPVVKNCTSKRLQLDALPSLKHLEINNCPLLQSFPPDFHKLSSLEELYINDCSQLQSLPAYGFPPSLTYLRIIGCPLLYECCKDESGLDWHKINHIRDRKILQHYW